MKLRNVPHLIGQGFVSFWRNGVMTTAAILVLISCMLVLGSFYVVIDCLNVFIDTQVDQQKTIVAYVDSNVSQERIDEILVELADLAKKDDANIESYEHFTKDEVLQQLIDDNKANDDEEMAEILSKLDPEQNPGAKNPLPDAFHIKFKSFDDDDMKILLRDLEGIFGSDNIKSDVDLYESLKTLRSTAAMIGLWLMALLLVVAVLVIMNTVKLTVYARRKEIAVMRYIGATSSFVVAPFIVEGVVIGVVSTIISGIIQFLLCQFVAMPMAERYMRLNEINAAKYFIFGFGNIDAFPIIPLAFLAVGLFAGVVASAISVKKHLNV